jgi:hypothetical protein
LAYDHFIVERTFAAEGSHYHHFGFVLLIHRTDYSLVNGKTVVESEVVAHLGSLWTKSRVSNHQYGLTSLRAVGATEERDSTVSRRTGTDSA